MEDKATLLFGEVFDRCTQAVEDAKHGYVADPPAEGSTGGSQSWQESLEQLQGLVLEEMKAAAERNMTLGVAYEEERRQRLTLEAAVATLTSRTPSTTQQEAGKTPGVTAVEAAQASTTPPTAEQPTAEMSGAAAIGAPVEGASSQVAATETAAAEPSQAAADVATATESSAVEAAVVAVSPPPPPLLTRAGAAETGACVGKRCPAGYEMIDRGDRCTCRPSSP